MAEGHEFEQKNGPEFPPTIEKKEDTDDILARLEARVLASGKETEQLVDAKVVEHDKLFFELQKIESLRKIAQQNYETLIPKGQKVEDPELNAQLLQLEGILTELEGQHRDVTGKLETIKAMPPVAKKLSEKAQAKREQENKEFQEFFDQAKAKIMAKAEQLAERVFAVGVEMRKIYIENHQQYTKMNEAKKAIDQICDEVERKLGSKDNVPEFKKFVERSDLAGAEALAGALEKINVGFFGNKGLKQLSSAETKTALQNYIVEAKKYEATEKANEHSQTDEYFGPLFDDIKHLYVESLTDEDLQKLEDFEKKGVKSMIKYDLMGGVSKYVATELGKLVKEPKVQKSLEGDYGWNSWGNAMDRINGAFLNATYSTEKVERRDRS